MGFELGFEKNNFLGNGIRTPLHDPLQCKAEFRVSKNALRSVAEALLISDTAY